jgi:fumarate hydratase subunit beta
MNKVKRIQTPLDRKTVTSLKAGDEVLLSGEIYTARDQAHLKIAEMIRNQEDLPVDFREQVIYYCGPAPSEKKVIGSCGPTTSGRMDPFTPILLGTGVKGMIGKGRRSTPVIQAIKHYGAVYFLAPSGAGAYLNSRVKNAEIVAFEDLGPEAIYKLTVEDFPLIVGIDCKGRNLYNKL